MEKMSLYKFTHRPLYKNDTKLKQKKWQTTNPKKKKAIPKFVKKDKSCPEKKIKNKKIQI